MAKLIVDIRPSLIALPFHRAFTRPVIELDGSETVTAWGATELPVGTGPHRISVYFRYRGQRAARLGIGRTEITVDGSTAVVRLTARLGPRNGSNFTITAG
ncbi:hypothetical protein [Kitasatospora sp. MAP5-34]|uniref:hypothetical protein n=1 Tax=Kitasatospora sp. MAP5-34 TaxID=3035102 RepID=UPI002473442E|nr:hypothetical protein [Kitasatospora sp. MAP5-34]